MPEVCPVDGCDSPHDTYTAVAMHMCKKDDDAHPWDTQNEALEHLSNEGLIGVGSGGAGDVVDTSDDGGGDTSDPPEPDTSETTAADGGNPLVEDADPDAGAVDGAGCCDDPTLDPAEGRYRLDDGTVVAADEGDECCSSCGALVEADGTVMR